MSITPIPISVETDAQMTALGNNGPTSEILAPRSCVQNGLIVTATGAYTNGGFAPNVYNRYGDVVQLYVYDAAGTELAITGQEQSPAIGGYGSWTVSAPLNPSENGSPARCVIAALPTHAEVLAPSTDQISCGSDNQPQEGYNLDYIDESGTNCQTARAVALASINPSIDSSYTADGFTCHAQPGPTSGQFYNIYTCANGAAKVVFKSRTP